MMHLALVQRFQGGRMPIKRRAVAVQAALLHPEGLVAAWPWPAGSGH